MTKKVIDVSDGNGGFTKVSLRDFSKNVVKLANSGGFGINNPDRHPKVTDSDNKLTL